MTEDDALDRHLPQQVPIDAVLDAGFRFADMSHQGSLLSLPERTQNWRAPASAFDLSTDDLRAVIDRSDSLDILVIGTGSDIAVLPEEILRALREAEIAVEVSATRAAVRTFNILLSEDRRVAAALMAIA